MKDGKYGFNQWLALCLALLTGLLSVCAAAGADPMDDLDIDLIIAENAVTGFNVRGEDGNLLVPRKAPEMQGRGIPDETELREDHRGVVGEHWVEPDYRGVVGYMALQTSWEVSRFNTFTQTPWALPVYEPDGEDGWRIVDTIKHKTLVLVVDQKIQEEKGKKFRGYLQAIRLDTLHMIWISVEQFVTVAYWNLPLEEAIQYGYCIAVYRDNSRVNPVDKKGHRGSLPDGMRVLLCDKKTARYFSPDKENNPILGIIFRSQEKHESYYRTFLFFNRNDLKMVY